MIFSKLHFIRLTTLIVLLFFAQISFSQKSQRIAYIDMEYILENVPEYKKAQQSLNSKVIKWRNELDKLTREIDKLKTDLATEREILTASLIVEKEDEIELKQKNLRKLEEKYFGSNGSMFLFRKRIIYPVQDLVYNSVQSIAKRYKYDFVLDKSSDLIMLYSNKKYDISELVLKSIKVDKKRIDRKNKRGKNNKKKELSDEQKKKLQARQEALKKIKDARAKRKKLIEEKRALLRKKKEDAKKNKQKDKKEEQNDN